MVEKILSALYDRSLEVQEVHTWWGYCRGGGMQWHGEICICLFDLAVVTLTLKIMSQLYLGMFNDFIITDFFMIKKSEPF